MRLIAWRRLRHRYDGQSRKGRRHAEHLRISTQRPPRLGKQEPHRRQEKRGISRQECVWQDIRKSAPWRELRQINAQRRSFSIDRVNER